MMIHIIKAHPIHTLAFRRTHLGHDGLDLGPGVHAIAVVVPLVAVVLERALAVAPGLDAQLPPLVAVVAHLDLRELDVVARVLAPGGLPADLRLALCARDALVQAHGRGHGPAGPVERVHAARVVRVVLEVHVGGHFGVAVGEEVFVRAEARRLPEGVEVRGPPDRVPDLQVLDPVVVVDGARVGRVPGLVEVRADEAVGAGGVGVDGGGLLLDGVVEDPSGDAVDDGDGAGGRCRDLDVGLDGEGGAGGGHEIKGAFDVAERLGIGRVCRRQGVRGSRCSRCT